LVTQAATQASAPVTQAAQTATVSVPPTSVPATAAPSITPLPATGGQAGATAYPRQNVPSLPDPGGYTWQTVASGLDSPIGLFNAGDGSGRLFAVEKAGVIRIIDQSGNLLDTPFLDIRDRVGSSGSEQGLLGLVFDPHYPQNGYFYIDYTDTNGDTHVARLRVSADPNVADPGTEKLILFQKQPYPNHNGGELAFGPDGYLYIGLGDGGSEGDPQHTGQSLDTWLGKLLRIDVEHGDPYSIPPDNPFVKGGGKPEIWAYGLRNPWRFSFDLATHDLYIGDVGQDNYEEVDFLPAGSPGGTNFGWSYREGMHPYRGTPPADLKLTDPVAEYTHSYGCAISGGSVYRGVNLPEWDGVYFYGDFCTGNIWGLLRRADGSWQNQLLFQTSYSISSFGQDQAGEVYLVDMKGNILRLAKK
jgi:glucose/arabinose dehydrogenase